MNVNNYMWTGRTWRFLPAWLLQVKRKANSREEANNGSILSLKLRVRNRGGTGGVRVAAFVVGAGSTEGGLRVSKSLSVPMPPSDELELPVLSVCWGR